MIGLRSPIFLCDRTELSFMQVHQISLPVEVIEQIDNIRHGWIYLPFQDYAEVGDIVVASSVPYFAVKSETRLDILSVIEIDPTMALNRTVIDPLHDRVLVRHLSRLNLSSD